MDLFFDSLKRILRSRFFYFTFHLKTIPFIIYYYYFVMIKLKNGLNHILKQSLGLDFKLVWSCWSLEQIVNEGHVSFSKHNVLIIARMFGNFPFVLPKIQRRSAPCFI
jgi:hypothetical protein